MVLALPVRAYQLPSVVDNSLDPAFPPIRTQGLLNSCTAFAVTYYQFTYMVAHAQGWDAKNGGNQFRFSPSWTFNLLNKGRNNSI